MASLLTRAALLICLALPAASWARVDVFISIAPPPLPVYVQPPLPDEGYIWSPGYWEYEDGDYYWIPGTWVRPPAVGMFWTPGYWAWSNGGYFFNRGYWGREVGFYGGVNYGYGYSGYGYDGGYWNRGAFYYNRSINNFGNRHFNRTYSKRVEQRASFSNLSYNGGSGINARPSTRERNYAREKHIAPTAVQRQHVRAAINNREQRASFNQGRPPIAATGRPGQFQSGVPARGAEERPDRSRQNDDRNTRDGRQDGPPSSRVSTVPRDPARDYGSQGRPQQEKVQDQPRAPQQREEQFRPQGVRSQGAAQGFQQGEAQRQQREQQFQQQREQQNQQRDQQMQQRRQQQQQGEQQFQQQRDQQNQQREQQMQQRRQQQQQEDQQTQQQRDQQRQQQRAQREQQFQQQRAQQAEQSPQRREQQSERQQREPQQRESQPRPRQDAQPAQREQATPQPRSPEFRDGRGQQGESRRERGRD